MYKYRIHFEDYKYIAKMSILRCIRHVSFGLLTLVLLLVIIWNAVSYRKYEDPHFRNYGTLYDVSQKGPTPTLSTVLDPENLNFVQNIPDSDYAASVSKTFLSSYVAYLSIKNTTDLKKIASNAFSTQTLVQNQIVYRLREVIKVRILIFDGYGKQMTTGGDILRIWLTDTSHKARANGYVIDHGNGSYTGHVRALWTGRCVIKASIAATKEHVALIQKYIEKQGILHDIFAGYRKNHITETTLCSVKPNVFGLTDMCNFTKENHGLHWFCGKPLNPNLTCKDWKLTTGANTDHMSTTERIITSVHKHMPFKESPTITIEGDHGFVPSRDLPCNGRPNKETWLEESPVGFYYEDKWYFRGCKSTFTPSKMSYEKCLRDQHLVLLDDSNIRRWFDHIHSELPMVTTTKGWGGKWFSFRIAERADLNMTLLYCHHEEPLYTGRHLPVLRQNIKSIASNIDEIPRMKKVTIVIHNMMHFARIPTSEFRAHVRDAKFAIGRLFKRVPGARVFIKGPHSATYVDIITPLDFIRKTHEQIFYEEFMEFHDKITYLNQWDLTTCLENVDVHPSHSTIVDMVNYFMSYLCKT